VLWTSNKAHSSGGPQVVSSPHPPASYRPAPSPPQPAQPNLDWSTSRRSLPQPPRSDTRVRANTTKDRRSPGPPASADLAIKSQTTVTVNGPVAERRAPQPPTAPQQESAAVTSLAKTAGATPRRRERKKEEKGRGPLKANDADIVKRLQQICTDANPTRLYRNLVKTGQG
jgi:p21-activated kinase 1